MSQTLRLVRHRSWFIPGNAATYKTLTNLGFPTTRIHEDAIGILKLVLGKHGIQARVVPFSTVRDKFYETAGEWWTAKGGKAILKTASVSFRIDATEAGRKAAESIKSKIGEFRDRWGLTGDIVVSESGETEKSAGKIKVYCEFGKSTRNPIMTVKRVAEVDKRAILELGNFRISTSTDAHYFFWRVETRCGSEWKAVMANKCPLTEVSNPKDFIGNLMIAFNNDFDHDNHRQRDQPLSAYCTADELKHLAALDKAAAKKKQRKEQAEREAAEAGIAPPSAHVPAEVAVPDAPDLEDGNDELDPEDA